MAAGRKGTKGHPVNQKREIAYRNGVVSRDFGADFDRLANPDFPLTDDERKAIARLRSYPELGDDERARILVWALEDKHIETLKNDRERRFYLPRGPLCFLKGMVEISSLVPEFQIHRNSRVTAFSRMLVFELGRAPTPSSVESAPRHYSRISLEDFADDLDTGRDYRYFLTGRSPIGDEQSGLSLVEWAVLWNELTKREIVKPRRTNSIWPTFTCYFIENRELPYGLADSVWLRKRVPQKLEEIEQSLKRRSRGVSLEGSAKKPLTVSQLRNALGTIVESHPKQDSPSGAEDVRSATTRLETLVKRSLGISPKPVWPMPGPEYLAVPIPNFVPTMDSGKCSACPNADVEVCPRSKGFILSGYEGAFRTGGDDLICDSCFITFRDLEGARVREVYRNLRLDRLLSGLVGFRSERDN